MMRKGFGILTVLFVLIIIFCVKGTVVSQGKHERASQNHYYAALEEEYLERAQNLLEEQGYRCCGINMRRVTYENGRREYTILLHHRKLERLSDEEWMTLENMLSEMEFGDETCRFIYEL